MAILDKLMFWKKRDEFADLGLGEEKGNLPFGDDFGMGDQPAAPNLNQSGLGQQYPAQNLPSTSPSPQFQQQFQQPRYENPQQDINEKNLEIISSKIDALRAGIESISQRLANLETMARGEEEKGKRRYY